MGTTHLPPVAHVLRTGKSLVLPELTERGPTGPVRSRRRSGQQVCQAVDNARLHTQAEDRLRELEALYRADEALRQFLRLDEVLQALVEVAAGALKEDKS
jgi:hypothetical protein